MPLLTNPLEKQTALRCAKTYTHHVLSHYHILLRKDRATFRHFLVAQSLGVEEDVVNKHPEFVRFILKNHLDKAIFHQNHEIRMIDQEPALLFAKTWTKWSVLKKQLFPDGASKSLSLEGRYSYLSGGLEAYDPKEWLQTGSTTEEDHQQPSFTPLPFKVLSNEEKQQLKSAKIEIIADCRGEKFPDHALENNDHCFVEMTNRQGEVYAFGFYPSILDPYYTPLPQVFTPCRGIVYSPDPLVYVPPVFREQRSFDISDEGFHTAIDFIQKVHNGAEYDVFQNNCTLFALSVLRESGVTDVPENKVFSVGLMEFLPQRIKTWIERIHFPHVLEKGASRFTLRSLGYKANKTVGRDETAPTICHPRKVLHWIRASQKDLGEGGDHLGSLRTTAL